MAKDTEMDSMDKRIKKNPPLTFLWLSYQTQAIYCYFYCTDYFLK